MKLPIRCLFVLMATFCNNLLEAQDFTNGYHRFSIFSNQSLDIVNDGKNNTLTLGETSKASGQYWKISPIGNGFYKLSTLWQGAAKCLDVINDSNKNKVWLTKIAHVTGQAWKLVKTKEGLYQLSTQWLGATKCLTVVKTEAHISIELANATPNNVNQLWKIEPAEKLTPTKDVEKNVGTDSIQKIMVQGLTIMVPTKIIGSKETQASIQLIDEKLTLVKALLQPAIFKKLSNIPIWLEYKKMYDGAAWYHSSKSWLTANGYPASMAKSVEIKNMRNFLDWHKDQPFMVLHELSHAYHDMLSDSMKQKIKTCFVNAVKSKKYESVPYINGGKLKHYALNSEFEFFAELTEAYFGKNDYFPFNREDLKAFDAEGYALMEFVWGKTPQ